MVQEHRGAVGGRGGVTFSAKPCASGKKRSVASFSDLCREASSLPVTHSRPRQAYRLLPHRRRPTRRRPRRRRPRSRSTSRAAAGGVCAAARKDHMYSYSHTTTVRPGFRERDAASTAWRWRHDRSIASTARAARESLCHRLWYHASVWSCTPSRGRWSSVHERRAAEREATAQLHARQQNKRTQVLEQV